LRRNGASAALRGLPIDPVIARAARLASIAMSRPSPLRLNAIHANI
jgi:hypothetical protein